MTFSAWRSNHIKPATMLGRTEWVRLHVQHKELFAPLRILPRTKNEGAGLAQWWEQSPSTNVAQDRFPDSCHMWVEFVGSASRGFSLGNPVCPSPQKATFDWICSYFSWFDWGAGMAQWWEHLPPTNVARRHIWVEFVGSLLKRFSPGTPVSPFPPKPTFDLICVNC